jgi:catechol 2,3-dioxygenase-like lactoylglutathione lyase family enzyme
MTAPGDVNEGCGGISGTQRAMDISSRLRQTGFVVPASRSKTMGAKITPWAFVLAVPELERSAAFFRDVLGFRVRWEDGQDWRLVERDTVRVMLGHCPRDMHPAELGSHNWFGYFEVDDVDALHVEITARGATCTSPADRDYGMREIVVTTPDGHRLVFGQELKGAP